MHRKLIAAAISLTAVAALAALPGAVGARPAEREGSDSSAAARKSSPRAKRSSIALIGQRRYKVEAVKAKAIDESGYDWSGSDEVFLTFGVDSPVDDVGASSKVYGSFDSGDTKYFGTYDSCMAPKQVVENTHGWLHLDAPGDKWVCDSKGTAAPIALAFELWEDDDVGFPVEFDESGPGKPDAYDDLIGRGERTYTASYLASVLPAVGYSITSRFRLGGPCGHQEPGDVCGYGWGTPTGPEYDLWIRVTRVADEPLRALPLAASAR